MLFYSTMLLFVLAACSKDDPEREKEPDPTPDPTVTDYAKDIAGTYLGKFSEISSAGFEIA